MKFETLFPTINTITAKGVIRKHVSDFRVIEHNDICFTESGEHLWLKIQKTDCNTAWVATQIASACKVPARQVGFAGLKDRHAITEQWFSVQLPKIKDLPSIEQNLPKQTKVLENHWHQHKLKTGTLKFNEFKIIIRDLKGDLAQLKNNIVTVTEQGAPNYFGPQRFGHEMNNINQCQDWFSGKIKVNNKNLRGLLISTARSHIFNLITAKRINDGIWNQVIEGDILQLDRSHSWFPSSEASPAELKQRLNDFDIHITAALWGEDEVQSSSYSADLENSVATSMPIYQQGLREHRVKQSRRAMRMIPIDLKHSVNDNSELNIEFKLLPGMYATSLLREILHVDDVQNHLQQQN